MTRMSLSSSNESRTSSRVSIGSRIWASPYAKGCGPAAAAETTGATKDTGTAVGVGVGVGTGAGAGARPDAGAGAELGVGAEPGANVEASETATTMGAAATVAVTAVGSVGSAMTGPVRSEWLIDGPDEEDAVTDEVSDVEVEEKKESKSEVDVPDKVDALMEEPENDGDGVRWEASAGAVSSFETCLRASRNSLYLVSKMPWYSLLQKKNGQDRIGVRRKESTYQAASLWVSTS